MDTATNAIIAPWAQYGALGAVVIALGVAVLLLWRSLDARTAAHLQAVEKCHEQTLGITIKQTETNGKLANAMEGLEGAVRAVLDVVKR